MKKTFISPKHLRTLRERKGWSREKLSGLSKITVRSIASYETATDEKVSLTQNSFTKLARALGEPPEVLAGDAALPTEKKPHEVTIQLKPRTKLNLDLIERKYGFTIDDVIDAAPLFFIKAAQETLTRQSLKLKEDRETFFRYASEHRSSGDPMFDLFGVDSDDYGHEEYFEWREAAVEKYDLCEREGAEEFYDDYYCYLHDGYPNPFAKFMEDECLNHRLGAIHQYSQYPQYSNRVPEYSICRDDLNKITCGSSEAERALTQGIVTLPEIPTYLWEPRNAGKRVEWLEDKYRQSVEQDEESADTPETG